MGFLKQTKSIGALYADLGQGLFQAGRYREAADALRKALDEDAADFPRAQSSLTLGKAYRALNKKSGALAALAEAVRLDPNTFDEAMAEAKEMMAGELQVSLPPLAARLAAKILPGAESMRSMAFHLVDSGEFSKATTVLKLIVSRWPDDVEAWEKLALALARQQTFLESVDAWQQVIRLDEERASGHRGLGDVYLQLEKHREAADAFGRALVCRPDDPGALLGRGIALRELGDLESSERDLQRVVELEPHNPVSYSELATTQQARDNIPAAVQTYLRAARLFLDTADYRIAALQAKQAIYLDRSSGPAFLLLGRALLGQGLPGDALDAFQNAAEREPTTEVYMEIARLYHSQGKLAEARQAVDHVLSLAPRSAAVLAFKGRILYQLEQYEEALAVLDEALAIDANQPEAWGTKGVVLEALGRPQEALEAYREALPAARDCYRPYGFLLLEEGRDEEAVAALDEALAFSPDAQVYAAKGQALYNLGRYPEAVPAFEEALRLDPGAADASRLRGFALRQLGQYEEAVVALQLAIDLDSAQERQKDPGTYAELGESLRSLDRDREAVVAFETALSQQGDDAWIWARYGEALRFLGKNEEAVKALEKAVALDEEESFAWASLGAAQTSLERHRSALQALDRAIALEPDSVFAWGFQSMLLRLCYRFEQAIEACDRALALDPEATWVCVEKGLALRQLGVRQREEGKYEEALGVLLEAVDREPNNSWAIAQASVCFYLLDRYEAALEAADAALKLDRSLIWLDLLRGLSLDELGRPEEARQAHDRSLEDSSDPKVYIDRADLYADFCAYDRAIQDYEQALELAPDLPDAYNGLAWFYADVLNEHLEEATTLAQRGLQLAEQQRPGLEEQKRYETVRSHILDTLGWAYYKRGMIAEATPVLEEAVRLQPEDLIIQDHLDACLLAGAQIP